MENWDSHSHAYSLTPEVIRSFDRIFLGGIDPKDWAKQIELYKLHPHKLILGFGLHPWTIKGEIKPQWKTHFDSLLDTIKLAQAEKIPFAIGETGLDDSDKIPKDHQVIQREAFQKHIELAQDLSKPLILHIVGPSSTTHREAITILGKAQRPLSGIVHGFSGDLDVAREYIKLGFFISVGGAILKPGYKILKAAVSKIDPQFMVLESEIPGKNSGQTGGAGLEALSKIAKEVSALTHSPLESTLSFSLKNLKALSAKL